MEHARGKCARCGEDKPLPYVCDLCGAELCEECVPELAAAICSEACEMRLAETE